MTRLELAASRPPDACANQLRYIPMCITFCYAGAKVLTFCETNKFPGNLFSFFFSYAIVTVMAQRCYGDAANV